MFNDLYCAIYSMIAIMTAKAYYIEKIDPLKSIFYTVLIGIFAFFISSVYVANFVFNPNRWSDLLEDVEIKYEEKYPYEKIPELNEEICEKNFVFDKTPDDMVVMKYNIKDETFWYWSDKKTIQYKNLETVARKYISWFKCKNIYIDRKTTLENDKKEQKKKEEEEEETKKKLEEWKTEKDKKDEDVFAKLKKPQEKRNKSKEIIAPSKANKYLHKGKLDDMSLFQPLLNRDKKKKKIKNDVSWTDWLHLQ